MFACAIAGSFAQPSTLTTLAANGPPSCSASPRGTTNSANSMTTAIRCGALPPPRHRLQVERPQQIAIDQLERRSRARAAASSRRLACRARCCSQSPQSSAAARRAHAAAAVVAQHDVVARRTSPRRETPAARAARPSCGTTSKTLPCSTNWAAEPERNRSRISPAQPGGRCDGQSVGLGHSGSLQLSWLARLRVGRERRRVGEQILHRAEDLLLIADPLRRSSPSVAVISSMRCESSSGSVDSAACSRISSTCCSMRSSSASMNAELALGVGALRRSAG